MTIFFKIMFPLAVPVIATISLFAGLAYWNDWINGLYYITHPELYNIRDNLDVGTPERLVEAEALIREHYSDWKPGYEAPNIPVEPVQRAPRRRVELPGSSVRMALAVIGMLPILIIFPFVQRHFVRGVVIGAIKG